MIDERVMILIPIAGSLLTAALIAYAVKCVGIDDTKDED